VEAWHAYAAGGTGALTLAAIMGRWLFSAFNGKADKKKVDDMDAELKEKLDRSTGQILFEQIKEQGRDITGLKVDTAAMKIQVENIEGGVVRIDDKIGRALNRS
jgi:hypothetical protein